MRQNRMWTVGVLVASACALTPSTLFSQDSQLVLSDSVSVKRVRCEGQPCKVLAMWFFGPAASQETADLLIANWGSGALVITGIHLAATGDVSEAFLDDTVDKTVPGTLKSMEAKNFELSLLALKDKRADRYSGEIRVRVENVEQSLSAPFTLYLRNGVSWVIVLLLVGLLMGRRLVKINETGYDNVSEKKLRHHLAGFEWGAGKQEATPWLASAITGVAWTNWNTNQRQYRLRVGAGTILLALAVYEGLKLLYFTDLTFGDNGILDYAAVFAWGFGADAGQRFITNLRWYPNRR